MNIKGNLTDSLHYPIKNWLKLIVVGIILLIPIVNLIGFGYYLRIIKSTLMGLDELPDLGGVRELFIDGIKILIVFIIYAILPLIFYELSFVLLTGNSAILLLVSAISVLIISIFAYMGVANMVYNNSEIAAAFRYHEILGRIVQIGWGKYILWWIIVTFMVAVAGIIIAVVGGILLYFVLGFLVFLLGYSYLVMLQARSIGLMFTLGGELR